MKKLLILGLVAIGIGAAATPAKAGGLSIRFNIGLPCLPPPPVCFIPPPICVPAPVCLPAPVVYGGCGRQVVYPSYYRERCWPGDYRRERYERERFERS